MNPKRAYAIFLRQLFLLRGSPTRLFQIFVWTLLDIVLWGFITQYLNSVAAAKFSFLPVFLGAVVLENFLTRVQQGVAVAFFEDVWSRNFLNVFASPLRVSEYLAGLVSTSVITSAFALVAMMLLAGAVFGLSLLSLGASLIPFLLILFLFGVALGILATAIVLRFGPASEWFVWPIPMVLAPFVGVFYPIATLPSWMQAISYALPPSYVFEGLRGVVLDGRFSAGLLGLGIALALIYVALAYGLFRLVYRTVIRRGLIARYSAETVS
jgi:ABC-2 type transport system permease protein